MKHIKKFNESTAHDDAIKQFKEDSLRPGIPTGPAIVGKRKLSEDFEKKAESYANLITYSQEYSTLKDMAMDMQMGDLIENEVEVPGPRTDLSNFIEEFQKTFPSFVNPGLEDLATGMKIPFYGRTRGENPSSRTVAFFKYLISKIQKPGYKL